MYSLGLKTRRNAFFVVTTLASFGMLAAPAHALGIFGTPMDMSGSVKETLYPSGTVVLNDTPPPLFDVLPGDELKLLDFSVNGYNGSGRSPQITSAFGSTLTQADGNGGVGVSQLILGGTDPTGTSTVRQLAAQSLWTQTYLYSGMFPIDVTLHLHIPELAVGLIGVAPQRTRVSDTETAEALASVVSSITHSDLTPQSGVRFDYGLRAHENQFPSGTNYLNFADVEILGQTGAVVSAPPSFNNDEYSPTWTLPDVGVDLDLGVLHSGDILSWTYTLTAEGTTHGFERGYFAFLGDPFGTNAFTDNLSFTIRPVDESSVTVPEASTCSFMLLGFAGLMWRRKAATSLSMPHMLRSV